MSKESVFALKIRLLFESEDSQTRAEVSSFAVRLRAGDPKVQVPSFLEVYGEPTENVIIDELKNWGHDCFVFQFAGHHEFLCLSRDRIPEDRVRHYIFGTIDGAQIQMRPSYIPTEVRLCKNSTA